MNNDLISRGKLKKHYAWWRETENGRKMADLFDEIVDAQPTAEVVERKKGKWIHDDPKDAIEAIFLARPKCSECGFEIAYETNYCPSCGADMRQ